MVGPLTVMTDENGGFVVEVPPSSDASISSGIPAILPTSIANIPGSSLSGTGEQIAQIAAANGGVIDILATRLVEPAPICLIPGGSNVADALRFGFTNRSGSKLEVMIEPLNSLSSVSGLAFPPSEFDSTDMSLPNDYLGFEWTLENFTWTDPATGQEMVSASWKLLGKEVVLNQPRSSVPICTGRGGYDGCRQFTDEMADQLFQSATESVRRLSTMAEQARKSSFWRKGERFVNPFLRQTAAGLRGIRSILQKLPANRFICESGPPQGCSTVAFPRAQLLKNFERIIGIKLPWGLRHMMRQLPRERKKFKSQLDLLPSEYVVCPNG
jgi:hypothetical protein